MKILIIGASGLLGRAIVNELQQYAEFEIMATAWRRATDSYHKLNLLDYNSVTKLIEQQKPNFILYVAAEKNPDICEKNPLRADALNVDAVKVVALAANKICTWIMYISTDYVFDGTQAPYLPDAKPNPLNAYGKSKLAGEQALWNITKNASVLRLPILYGSTTDLKESAVTTIAHTLLTKPNQSIEIDDWAIRYPTHTADVAIVCRQMLEHKINHADFNGTFHWSSDEAYTKYQIALLMSKILNTNPSNLIPQSLNKQDVMRPYNCHLDTSALYSIGIGAKRNFKDALNEICRSIVN